jgi:hypothetical protein
MSVPSYQMHNILNVYSKKLRHNITTKDQNTSVKSSTDRADSTSEGKRRATIEKVSKEIFDKIIRFGSQTDSPLQKSELVKIEKGGEIASVKTNEVGFVFNVIDGINKKTTNTVSVEDSKFLIQRLEQLSQDTMKMKKKDIGIEDKGEIETSIANMNRVEESLTASIDNG